MWESFYSVVLGMVKDASGVLRKAAAYLGAHNKIGKG